MSIADQITRLSNAKEAIKKSITNKGVKVDDKALLDEYPALIDSIEGGGGNSYYEELYNQRTSNGTNMKGLFSYCNSPELDLSNIDISKATDMSYMFANCSSQIKLGKWDTSKVTNTSYMFQKFTNNKNYLDLSVLDFSNTTNTSNMFEDCNIDYIDIRNCNFDFSKITNVHSMLKCNGTTLDLSNWDITGLTNMTNMTYFCYCKKIDLTNWVTTSVTNMNGNFYYCSDLEELIIPDWDMTNVTSTTSMFSSCSKLRYIDTSRCNTYTMAKIASLLKAKTQAAYGTILVPKDLSQETYDALVAKYWAPIGAALTPSPTNIEIIAELDEIMPGKSTKVYFGTYEPWYADPSKIELAVSDSNMAIMKEDNEVISTGVIGDIVLEVRIKDTQEIIGTKTIAVSETDSYPNLVKFRAASKPSSSSTIITVNGSNKKLSALTYDSVTDIYSYDNGEPITSIKFGGSSSYMSELIKLNTNNITNMEGMFQSCGELITLDASNFNTSNVTSMVRMFQNCGELTSLDVSNFDTSNVTSMMYIFASCPNLTKLDLSNFDMTNVSNTGYMLSDCDSLHILRLDNCSYDTISKIINSYDFPTDDIGVTRTIYCKEENAAGLEAPKNWEFKYIYEEEDNIIDPDYINGVEPYIVATFNSEPDAVIIDGEQLGNWQGSFDGVTWFEINGEYHHTQGNELVYIRPKNLESELRLYRLFENSSSLVEAEFVNFSNKSIYPYVDFMFYNCGNLTSLDLSSFNISNVENMEHMFFNCGSLETVNISGWDINDHTNTNIMFMFCDNLHSLYLVGCNYDAISKIINDGNLPTGLLNDKPRVIYCSEEDKGDLVAPDGWEFSYK